jgi:formylglycine-generating enzyme required for sulfatase activity
VFALDRPETEKDPPDAFARPSKPYILMDRGFGHAGYPAISVSHKGAVEFCKWLAHKTGKRVRLPTEAEWEQAAKLGAGAAVPLGDVAWFKDNSELDMRITTHPVATKKPDALGLYDVLGNAAEWTTSTAGTGVARGGSFREAADAVTPLARRLDDKSLNRTDPQIPRSVWWLADGGFIGFRVLCE